MMLEVGIGESVIVRMDDDMTNTRLNPEQVEDYLTRMRRTALKVYRNLPDAAADPVEVTETDDQA